MGSRKSRSQSCPRARCGTQSGQLPLRYRTQSRRQLPAEPSFRHPQASRASDPRRRDEEERMSIQLGDEAPDFSTGVDGRPDPLPRLPRRLLGRAVLTPRRLHAGLHDRAGESGGVERRVREAKHEGRRAQRRSARLAPGNRARRTRPGSAEGRRPRSRSRRRRRRRGCPRAAAQFRCRSRARLPPGSRLPA